MNRFRKHPLRSLVLSLVAVVLFCVMPLGLFAQEGDPIVFTFNGPVGGTVSSGGIREFLGIPYAAAPVGNLRWRPPVPHPPLFSILDATQFANHCPQPATPFGRPFLTEDCLFPNVFTPGTGNFFIPRPVIVWIHGGSLVTSEMDDYDPTAMVQDGVIVITITRRAGPVSSEGCLPPIPSAEQGSQPVQRRTTQE